MLLNILIEIFFFFLRSQGRGEFSVPGITKKYEHSWLEKTGEQVRSFISLGNSRWIS